MSGPEIVFVYNADGPIAGKAKDFVHKIVRPSTYDCRLCAVTYGFTGMKSKWRHFIASLDAAVSFLHRDELGGEHSSIVGQALPGAWQRTDGGSWNVLVDSPTMRSCDSLDELIELMRARLSSGAAPV